MKHESVGRLASGCILLLVCASPLARADGLLCRTPDSGAWAIYDVAVRATQTTKFDAREGQIASPQDDAPKQIDYSSKLKLSSVETLTDNGKEFRWLEIESKSDAEGTHPRILLKVLIPTEDFAAGKDSLARVRKVYAKYGDEEPFEALGPRKAYELDRFRYLFPPPAPPPQRGEAVDLETAIGELSCDVVRFRQAWKGSLDQQGNGRMEWDYQFVLFASDKVPFGAAEMNVEGRGSESASFEVEGKRIGLDVDYPSVSYRVRLATIGSGAESQLPDCR